MTSDRPRFPPRPDGALSPLATRAPWPRFTDVEATRVPRRRIPAPHEPWPRWGWFPREARTWTFAPGPALTSVPPARPGVATPEAAVPEPDRGKAETRPPSAEPYAEASRFPVRRPVSMALIPVRRDLTLADVRRAAKRHAPAAAVGAAVAVAAMALFRRR